jgi:hypothetical protein
MPPYVRSIAGVAAAFRLRKTQAEACAYRKKICNVRVNTKGYRKIGKRDTHISQMPGRY